MASQDAEKSDPSPSASSGTSPSPIVERAVLDSTPQGSVPLVGSTHASTTAVGLAPQISVPPSSPPPSMLRPSGSAPARQSSSILPPSPGDELADALRRTSDSDFSPEQAIEGQIVELEAWAMTNVQAERIDALRFWGLRVLAFFGAGSAAASAGLHQIELAVSFSLLSALAIVVDAAWPSVSDRVARRRAIHDLREFQHQLKIKWDKVRLAHPNPNAPKRIAHALVMLDQIQTKREEIGRYLGEAAPGVTRPLD